MRFVVFFFALLLTGGLAFAPAQVNAQILDVRRVASGFSRPVYLTAPGGDTDRVFILEQQSGRIKILDLTTGFVNATPFLRVTGISTGSEKGVLGLAFDPDYSTNGFFYVNFTAIDGSTRVARYQVSAINSSVADASSQTSVLTFSQPQANHNGGWMGFGPDGFLYIATGDGGASNDSGMGHNVETGNAQDLTSLLGKMLRIDVGGDDFPADPERNYAIPPSNPFVGVSGKDEIWSYGLRNPWRASFDRLLGDLYIADVGQNNCEEIDLQLTGSAGGENYGWRLREGVIATPTGSVGGPKPSGAIDPLIDYSHNGTSLCSNPPLSMSGFSVTGGYVYRGPDPVLQGRYFFGDYITDRVWSLRWDGSHPSTHDGTNYTDLKEAIMNTDFGTVGSISSFGEDGAGNLYVLDLGGDIFQFVPEPDSTAVLEGTLLGVAMIAHLGRRRSLAHEKCSAS